MEVCQLSHCMRHVWDNLLANQDGIGHNGVTLSSYVALAVMRSFSLDSNS